MVVPCCDAFPMLDFRVFPILCCYEYGLMAILCTYYLVCIADDLFVKYLPMWNSLAEH